MQAQRCLTLVYAKDSFCSKAIGFGFESQSSFLSLDISVTLLSLIVTDRAIIIKSLHQTNQKCMDLGYSGAKNSLHQNNQKCMGLDYSGAKKSVHQNNQKCMGLGYFGAMHLCNPCLC